MQPTTARTATSASTVDDRSIPEAVPTIGLFEFVLEVADLDEAERFYHEVIGLPIAHRWSGERRATYLGIGRDGFLGLWPRETGGEHAIHQGRGGAHVHFAVRVPHGTLGAVESRLEALGIAIEAGWEFGPGNRALYCDDPDGNVVELTERVTLWEGSPTSDQPGAS